MLNQLTELIIPFSTQQLMTPTDWLLIVLGIYFHDLGMLVTKNEYRRREDSDFPAFRRDLFGDQRGKDYENKLSRLPSDEQERFLYQKFVRANHAKRIRAWITNTERAELGVSSGVSEAIDQILSPLRETFRFDLGLVCESHHLDNLDDFRTYKVSQPYGNSDLETGNLHYAALLLRTADLLHITQDRTPSIVFKTISPTDPISQTEWAKQMAVRRVRAQVAKNAEGLDQPDLPRNTIEVHATFKDENGFFGLTSYLDYAERELKQNHAWGQLAQKNHGVSFEFPWERIDQRPIETIDFLKDQFEFKIDTFKILELLTGHTLYNDSGVVLRELVQNSIDAVRLQFSDSTRKRSRDEGRVAIQWDSQARVLSVTDNGTGMSQEIIKNHLLEVGSSRYQDPKFQEEHPEFSSISRFGIGVLSTFMVADEVEYLTYFPGEDKARRLLLRSVHGKYLVRLLDKTDNRVRHLVPHGTEVRLKFRHTAEMDDPLELAKKWIVVPDCTVTVQRDEGPVETVGFWGPKEALESILTKTGYDLAADTGRRIKVEQVEKNGVALAYALEWSQYFREWTFLSVPLHRQQDQEISADDLLGTCVEGIRVDIDSPGFRERNIYAIANATGRLAPRTNVARSGLDMSSEVTGLMRNLYSIYFSHVENEVRALQAERGFSPTWAAGEPEFILGSLLRSQKERGQGNQVEIIDAHAFAEAAGEAKLILVEDENHREVIAPKELLSKGQFWTVDCALFRSMERLLREVPESVSVRALTTTLSQSIGLPTGVLLSHWDLHEALSNLIFAKREVGEICIDERQRRTDLKWIVQTDNPKWISPLLDWPRASNNVNRMLGQRYYYSPIESGRFANLRILHPQAQVELNGVTDEMIVSAFHLDFLLPSPLQAFYTKETQLLSTEANDLRWALLWVAFDNINWISGPTQADRVFEELGREEGLWDNLVNYCGETAAPEITAFRVAARESSWKRFGAALWARGGMD